MRHQSDEETTSEGVFLLDGQTARGGWGRPKALGGVGLCLFALAALLHFRSPGRWALTPEGGRSFMQAQGYGAAAYGAQGNGVQGYGAQGYGAQAFGAQGNGASGYPTPAVPAFQQYPAPAPAAGYPTPAVPAFQQYPAPAPAAGYPTPAVPAFQQYPAPAPAPQAAPVPVVPAAAPRVCVGLPGVKLKGNQPVAGEHAIADDGQCIDWCEKHTECKQAVFSWDTKTCELFTEASAEPERFKETWPWFNSSYCGSADTQAAMMAMLQQVYDMKPWVPSPHNCSWAGDNCLDTKCCADVCKANYDFTECEDFTCYKRDEYWAGCKSGAAPEGWDGAELGGHPTTEEIANHWKEQKKGIMQCDDYSLFDGLGGGSIHNIASFVHAWQLVKEDGRWKQNDWTIKVDPDAVFFPAHFRTKVETEYRTPQGATVYLRNTFYKFQFLGALEAITREGLEVYFARGWECENHLTQEGGEDYWLLQCLEGLGLDYHTDTALLHDKYAADENCGDPNGVAHHFFKKIEGGDGWETCWHTANDAWNQAHPE